MPIIIILSLIPVVIWGTMQPLSIRFFDFMSTTTSIGQVLGLLGMTLFALNLMLASRLKILDRYFKGLDKVYSKHSSLGSIAFSLLIFHPLFLAAKYLTYSLRDAAMFFVPFISPSVTFGIISLLLMIILISFTFYIKLKYHIWKFSHKFMTLAFVLAIIHTFMISSDVSRNNYLRYYIISLSLIGLIFSVRQAFLNKFLKQKIKYVVKNVVNLNKDITSIEMAPVGNRFTFKSGQFVFVSFKDSFIGEESHPFSIASGESDLNFKLVIKSFGDFTNRLKELKPGTAVDVDGPYGNFSFKNVLNKNQIWIAGGIGVTPFLSMAQSLDESYTVDLYYCVRDEAEAVLLGEFNRIAEKNNNFKVKLWTSIERGFISANIINTENNHLGDKEIFLCGPSVFMESLNKQFLSLNVGSGMIHYENFNFN